MSAAPQALQKRDPSGTSLLQLGQRATRPDVVLMEI
jgi:hypothetical protein